MGSKIPKITCTIHYWGAFVPGGFCPRPVSIISFIKQCVCVKFLIDDLMATAGFFSS